MGHNQRESGAVFNVFHDRSCYFKQIRLRFLLKRIYFGEKEEMEISKQRAFLSSMATKLKPFTQIGKRRAERYDLSTY